MEEIEKAFYWGWLLLQFYAYSSARNGPFQMADSAPLDIGSQFLFVK